MSSPSQPPKESQSVAVFTDGITALSYLGVDEGSEKASLLASSCWDGSLRVHDTASRTAVLSHAMECGPLLSLATYSGSSSMIATGGLDGSVRCLDVPTSTMQLIGKHQPPVNGAQKHGAGVSCLSQLDENILVSATWGRSLKVWDIRQSQEASSIELPGKAFSMDVDRIHGRVAVVTSGRRTCFVDIKEGGDAKVVLERESSLKYQSRCIRFFPKGHAFAMGSVEGRVGVEFLDELGIPSTMKKYAFKCHRLNDTIFPVNAIAFHPRFQNVFATGGCDGGVILWDGEEKKKLTTLPSLSTSISALAFNHDGTELAMASSYTFEEGDREHPQDELFVRKVLDSECLPKPKS